MSKALPSRRWRIFRQLFKWFRVLLLLLCLSLLTFFTYLNQVGLPDFLKTPLLGELKERGLDLQFSRLRYHWFRGLVAERVEFQRAKKTKGEKIFFEEVVLGIEFRGFRTIKVTSLGLQGGDVELPLSGTNEVAQTIRLQRVDSRLQIPEMERWKLDHFHAEVMGIRLAASGALTNISRLRDWGKPRTTPKTGPSDFETKLREALRFIQETKFDAPPELTVAFEGDGARPEEIQIDFNLKSAQASTPVGMFSNLLVTGQVARAENQQGRQAVTIEVQCGQGQIWTTNEFAGFALRANWVVPTQEAKRMRGLFHLSVQHLRVPGFTGEATDIRSNFNISTTNLFDVQAEGNASFRWATNQFGKAGPGKIDFLISPRVGPREADPSWSWWEKIEPWNLAWQGTFEKIESPRLKVDTLALSGKWSAPLLVISNLSGNLYQGTAAASGVVHVPSRRVEAAAKSDFEPTNIFPLLTRRTREWMEQFTWKKPPELEGGISLTLPSWTNRQPDWQKEVVPTLFLHGHFNAQEGSFRKIPALSASSHFTYSNMVWHLPDLRARRPEGTMEMDYWKNEDTRDFYYHIQSSVHPEAYRPLLRKSEQKWFDEFQFETPPQVSIEIWGNWRLPDRMGWRAKGSVSNFVFRGEKITGFATLVAFTNQVLQFVDTQLEHASGRLTAPFVEADFNRQTLVLSNALSTMDPMVVARGIGRKVASTIEPYQFREVPSIRSNGKFNFKNIKEVDLRFDIVGKDFHWWKFNLESAMGLLHWTNQWLVLTNFSGTGYGNGQLAGNALFNFAAANGPDFQFDLSVAEIGLPPLIRDLSVSTNNSSATNKLAGLLYGQLTITTANAGNWKSWQGYGKANVREGVLWDIPIFGIFSPIFNAIVPGLGHSQAKEASAVFNIANSVIQTEDLEVRAKTLRMNYRGTLDFDWNLDARVEAEILRDAGVLGHLVSFALKPISKLFEYKVTGTLSQPEAKPMYVPRLLLMPFRPFHTIKELLDFDSKKEKDSVEPEPPLRPPSR